VLILRIPRRGITSPLEFSKSAEAEGSKNVSPIQLVQSLLKKKPLKKLGSELEEKEKDNKIDSKAPNYYYRIIEEARKMEL